jgi:hypothetical protein
MFLWANEDCIQNMSENEKEINHLGISRRRLEIILTRTWRSVLSMIKFRILWKLETSWPDDPSLVTKLVCLLPINIIWLSYLKRKLIGIWGSGHELPAGCILQIYVLQTAQEYRMCVTTNAFNFKQTLSYKITISVSSYKMTTTLRKLNEYGIQGLKYTLHSEQGIFSLTMTIHTLMQTQTFVTNTYYW